MYCKKFPNSEIMGYSIDSLIDERTVNEEAVKEMFLAFPLKTLYLVPI